MLERVFSLPRKYDLKLGTEFEDTFWTSMYEAEMYSDKAGHKFRVVHCRCRCGNEKDVLLSNILQHKSISCGCHRAALQTRHGKCNQRLYHIWENMIQRCTNPNNDNYHNYGERGICVCDSWRDFKNFYEWATNNGYEKDLTLDRIDVNGNYEDSNCRWATNSEQANNKRTSHKIEYNGVTKTMTEWAREFGLTLGCIQYRLEHNWPIDKLFDTTKHVNQYK